MISAVVLAAGVSKRFGKQKLEQPYKGKPLLQWTLDVVKELKVRKVLISSKWLDISKFDVEGFDIFINEESEKGLSSSVKLAVSKCEKSEGLLLFLGDMPEITLCLAKRVLSFGTSHIVFPSFKGVKGFPVFLPFLYFKEVKNITGDVGLRDMIKKHKDECISFEDDWKCVYDVDTVEDMKRGI